LVGHENEEINDKIFMQFDLCFSPGGPSISLLSSRPVSPVYPLSIIGKNDVLKWGSIHLKKFFAQKPGKIDNMGRTLKKFCPKIKFR
jgi:hypothetical protein